MQQQVVFFPIFQKGSTFQQPNGSLWDLLPPDHPEYELQFVECYTDSGYALGRYMYNHGGDLWFVGKLRGYVEGSMGTLPCVDEGGGGRVWEECRDEFYQVTGVYINR